MHTPHTCDSRPNPRYDDLGKETDTMRVFWPKAGLTKDEGVVVGWRVEDTLCVVGIVEEWVSSQVSTFSFQEAV